MQMGDALACLAEERRILRESRRGAEYKLWSGGVWMEQSLYTKVYGAEYLYSVDNLGNWNI